MTLQIIFALMLIHVLADQILQFPMIQKSKDDSFVMMTAHVTTWALWMIPVCVWMVLTMTHDMSPFLWWAICSTGHFIIDYGFSFVINSLVKRDKLHYAVAVIHINTLIVNVMIIKVFFDFVVWG